jgi:hypothetical protein
VPVAALAVMAALAGLIVALLIGGWPALAHLARASSFPPPGILSARIMALPGRWWARW